MIELRNESRFQPRNLLEFLLRSAWRMPHRPALSCAGAAGGHRAELQGVHRQLPGCRRMEGGQPAGRDDQGQLVGSFQRAGTERAGRTAQHQQPEHSRYRFRTSWRRGARLPKRARSIGRRSPRIHHGTGHEARRICATPRQANTGQHSSFGLRRLKSHGRPISGARSATRCMRRNMPRRRAPPILNSKS